MQFKEDVDQGSLSKQEDINSTNDLILGDDGILNVTLDFD
jgi:hypothetical protein